MGIELREAEGELHAGFKFLRHVVLEAFSFSVHLVEVVTQGFGQIQLEQSVMPDNLKRHAATGCSERDPMIPVVNDEFKFVQPLDHVGD
jgi:hypothetical protein